jgi:cytochrome c553
MASDALIPLVAPRVRGHQLSRIAGFEVISSHSALRLVNLLVAVALLVASSGEARAGDVKAGRAKALMCQACHGVDGLSKVPDAPNIAGQTEAYLVAQLQAYKSGARKNDAMSLVAPSLSDNDVEDLAAYFSAIEVKIVKIPGD